MAQFDALVGRIEDAYERLGHRLGWRFLYGPARTLAPAAQLTFVGLNPGGSRYEPPAPSVESGNAYRVENWGRPGGLNTLQIQIGRLYAELATRLAHPSPARLMDETLAVNFCPFRSPSWDALANKERSVEFSRELWNAVLAIAAPRAMVCLGDLAFRHLSTALMRRHARLVAPPRVLPVGWGNVAAALAQYESVDGPTLLVRLPHLSRFGIFGRAASRPAVDEICMAIAESMRAASC